MKPPVETVRISQRGKEILIKLKRNTHIEHWNVLCRWALCASLHRDSRPPKLKGVVESNVEMSWRTFAGPHADIYTALVRYNAELHGVDVKQEGALSDYFRAHLERGISNIQNVKNLPALLLDRGY